MGFLFLYWLFSSKALFLLKSIFLFFRVDNGGGRKRGHLQVGARRKERGWLNELKTCVHS